MSTTRFLGSLTLPMWKVTAKALVLLAKAMLLIPIRAQVKTRIFFDECVLEFIRLKIYYAYPQKNRGHIVTPQSHIGSDRKEKPKSHGQSLERKITTRQNNSQMG